ncbi:hypothetical protein FCV25MIE_22032 [Fagus crenata]
MGNLDHSFIDLSLQERGWEEALYDGFGGLDIPIRGLSSQLSEWVRLFRGLEDFWCGMRCSLHIGLVVESFVNTTLLQVLVLWLCSIYRRHS